MKRTLRLCAAALWTLGLAAPLRAVQMSSWITYQTQRESRLDQYGRKFTSICVFAYDFDAADNLRPATAWVDTALAAQMQNRAPGRPVFITIVNDVHTDPPQNHSGSLVLRILSDDARRARHIQQLVALSARADGLDIDYEGLWEGTRPHFSRFIRELRAALPPGKLLSVVCQPKTDDADGPRGNAIDWRAIHPHVDVMRVMTYYFSFGASAPGPSAPLDKVGQVTALAKSQIPLEKLQIVLTQFGWDWPSGGQGHFVTADEARQVAASKGATPFRDPASQFMRLNYVNNGTFRQVWYPDAATLRAQVDVIKSRGVNKVDVWELGVGDTDFWTWAAENTENPAGGDDDDDPPAQPAPVLGGVTPSSVEEGSSGFTLTANGSSFVPGSVIRWNGQDRGTAFVNGSRLTASIPTADVEDDGEAEVRVFTPPPGGGLSEGKKIKIEKKRLINPEPSISGLIPASAAAGGPAFALTVEGADFVSGASVLWNGLPLSTTYENSARLTAQVPAGAIAQEGEGKVRVFNPPLGGGLSNEAVFPVHEPPVIPPPALSSLSPDSTAAGGPAFTLTVNGGGFENGSCVRWDGAARPTAFMNPTRLDAAIPASDIVSPGAVAVTVGCAGTGESTALAFQVMDVPIVPPPPQPRPTADGGPAEGEVRPFPNPWSADRHKGLPLVFDGVPPGSTIRIFTTSAGWIKSLTATGQTTAWDLTTDAGEPAGSGLYIYLVTEPDGRQVRGKTVIVR